jgi:hypothetical protein
MDEKILKLERAARESNDMLDLIHLKNALEKMGWLQPIHPKYTISYEIEVPLLGELRGWVLASGPMTQRYPTFQEAIDGANFAVGNPAGTTYWKDFVFPTDREINFFLKKFEESD